MVKTVELYQKEKEKQQENIFFPLILHKQCLRAPVPNKLQILVIQD